jgi:cleavage and polyadenylation specificity factor subunit 1
MLSQDANKGFISLHDRIGRVGSQRLTLFNGLWDVFTPRGLLPGGGVCVHKHPLGVTVRQIEVWHFLKRFATTAR